MRNLKRSAKVFVGGQRDFYASLAGGRIHLSGWSPTMHVEKEGIFMGKANSPCLMQSQRREAEEPLG